MSLPSLAINSFKIIFKIKILILALSSIILINANAQTDTLKPSNLFALSLEELMSIKVTTASKKEESMDKAPNVMYVVRADDIEKKGFKNLKDVLQTIPGFDLFLHELGQNIQVRGLAANENEKVSIMINGNKIDQFVEPIHFDGAINLDNVEKIEIIIGPGSVLYGAETLEAIVNIIPKMINGIEAKVTTGTDGTLSATITTGNEISEDVSFMASLTYLQRNGYDAYTKDALLSQHVNLLGKEIIEKINPSIFMLAQMNLKSWTFNLTHENLETPDYMVISNKWGNDGSRFSYINVVNAKNEKKWSDNLNGTLLFSYDNKRQLRVVTESGNAHGPSFDLSQQAYGAEYSLQLTKQKHFLQGGIQTKYKLNRHNYAFVWVPEEQMPGNQLTMDSITFVENMIRQTNTLNLGLYVSEEYQVLNVLKLIGAARFDYDEIIETDKVYISPRLAIIYTPTEKLTLKAMYNRATRMPNPWESSLNTIYGTENIDENYVDSVDFFSWAKLNPNVQRPEILTDYEMQGIYYFEKTRLSLNAYYQVLEDFISWSGPYTNVGDYTGYGGEMSANTKFNKLGVLLTASYNKNKFNKISTTGGGFDEGKRPENLDGEMLSVPKITSHLTLTYDLNLFKGSLSTYLGTRYLTNIPMRINNTGDNIPSDYTYANNRVYLDFNIGWTDLNSKFRVDLTGKNILNNQDFLSMTWSREFYQPRGSVFMLAIRYYFMKTTK